MKMRTPAVVRINPPAAPPPMAAFMVESVVLFPKATRDVSEIVGKIIEDGRSVDVTLFPGVVPFVVLKILVTPKELVDKGGF